MKFKAENKTSIVINGKQYETDNDLVIEVLNLNKDDENIFLNHGFTIVNEIETVKKTIKNKKG